MDAYIVFLSLIAFTSLLLGFVVFIKSPGENLNRFFLFKSFVLAIFALLALRIQYSQNKIEAAHWHKYYMLFMMIVPLLFVQFYSFIIDLGRWSKCLVFFLYIVFICLFIYWLCLDPTEFCEYSRINGFWVVSKGTPLITFVLFTLYIIFTPGLLFFFIWRWFRSCNSNKERFHARLVLYSLLLTYVLSFGVDYVIKRYYPIPHMTPVFFLFYLSSVYYALNRYYFLNNELNNHMDVILDNINDMFFFLDRNKQIRKVNAVVLSTFQQTQDYFLNRKIQEFIMDPSIDTIMEGLEHQGTEENTHILFFKIENVNIPAKTFFSIVKDKFDDFLGILVIAKPSMKSNQFQKLYNITKREMDILVALMAGKSNVQISETLYISRRTVETHLFSLYSKLNVKNKIELNNLINEYGLFL